jgi:D-serine deaminase-like pyridoxal phosphate-dependent protein
MTTQISKLTSPTWFQVADVSQIPSPGLLVYRARVEENLRRMLAIAVEPARLRPHIKTHKMRELVRIQLAVGITKFKCATIAEAEMAADTGAADVLLAYQPVGPNIRRVAELVIRFPRTRFAVVVDDAAAIMELSQAVQSASAAQRSKTDGQLALDVLLDLDVGQHRTGIAVGPKAVELYRLIAGVAGLNPGGLHAYDGHLSQSNLTERAQACDQAFQPVAALRRDLLNARLPVPRVVAGGTPTFRLHSQRGDVECSPGTCIFWDAQYAARLPDLDFLPAALVLTRVVSKPSRERICLDLGHKALASEMPPPRVKLFGLEEARPVLHSEEHLVLETTQAEKLKNGDCLYGVPWHICPTVALYNSATVIQNGMSAENWLITRERRLTL